MKHAVRALVDWRTSVAAGVLNALVFGLAHLYWLPEVPEDAVGFAVVGALPWALIALLSAIKRGDSMKSNLPAIFATVLIAIAIAVLCREAIHASECWECHDQVGTDSLSRAGGLWFVTSLLWTLLSALFLVLVLFVGGGRIIAKLRAPGEQAADTP